ncbi:FAD-dependent oxidoreductase [Solihabitans fulvus]|uniref:FAD-dependent oxidoreductase n=1 Tax=Solihabitans fulvus TaxID=1892852 RepID=A0A5B2X4E7_9PSEU|nr:FAD-dependent monooxygenase [Solihabitans fulvus]KAA2258030.1 FAD-dependent oxidoreductase [Solihabitans fulvus]
MDFDVIVAGGGPTGLLLANELGLAGVRVVVLERQPVRTGQSKALNLQPRTAEVLDLRGWLDPIMDRAVTTLPAGHFSGTPLDYRALDTRFPYQVGIPQARVEEFLESHLAEFGVPVLRGHELTGFRQDADGVTVTVAGPAGVRDLRAAYLVGADGGRSVVRKHLGVGFPGRGGRVSMVVADVVLRNGDTDGEWRLPTFEPHEGGSIFLLPLGDGVHRILFGGPGQQGVDRDAPVTEDEVRAALRRAEDGEPELREIRWASRFTDASRQVERYRSGRVLLAGDAAHIHLPAGGQGLNLGMQDAFNLGWKLAAEVRGAAPAGLLDSYHDERHPVGAAVLRNTRAQGLLMIPDPDVLAMRALLADLLTGPEANRRIAGMISGLDIRYPMPDAPVHPLLGSRLPAIDLPTGRGLFLVPRPEFGDAARPWRDRVDHAVVDGAHAEGADAVLVRPDGHVCWVGPEVDDGLRAALTRWFGQARQVTP